MFISRITLDGDLSAHGEFDLKENRPLDFENDLNNQLLLKELFHHYPGNFLESTSKSVE